MKIRKIALFILVVIMTTGICGCKGYDSETTVTVAPTVRGVKIPGEDLFAEKNEGYKIRNDSQYGTAMQTAMALFKTKDNTEEVMFFNVFYYVNDLLDSGEFVDMSEVPEFMALLSKTFPSYQDMATVNGKVVGIPLIFTRANQYVAAFDPEKCAEAGLNLDELDTFQKLGDKILEINAKKPGTIKLPIVEYKKFYEILISEYTAKTHVMGKREFIYDTPEFKEYLAVLKDWYRKGLAGQYFNGINSQYDLGDGSIIKFLLSPYPDSAVDLDIAPLPTFSEGDPYGLNVGYYVLNPNGKNVELGKKAMVALLEGQMMNFPIVEDFKLDPNAKLDTKYNEQQSAAFGKMMERGKAGILPGSITLNSNSDEFFDYLKGTDNAQEDEVMDEIEALKVEAGFEQFTASLEERYKVTNDE